MDHVAIMKKSWGLVPKILDGRKKIESRWSKFKIAPWGKVKKGDSIYFKNSGEKIVVRAEVSKVLAFESLSPGVVKKILTKHGGDKGIGISDIKDSYKWLREKKYCTLIFLKKAKEIKPFSINKAGFGNAAAWLAVGDINKIKV